jgi:ribonuclease HI
MWKRPDRGWLKINSDGAFSERTSEGGWGVIIRDEEGDVVEAAAGKLTRVLDAFQSEVEACLASVMLAGETGPSELLLKLTLWYSNKL